MKGVGKDWKFEIDEKCEKDDRTKKGGRVLEESKDLLNQESLELSESVQTLNRREQAAAVKERHRVKLVDYGSIKKRFIATIIDGGIVVACYFAGKKYSMIIKDKIVDTLRNHEVNIYILQENITYYCFLLIAVVIPLLLFMYIIYRSYNTIGKNIVNIRVGGKREEVFLSRFKIILRECFIKPLSMITIIGPLLMFTNKSKRTLHDFICGTSVYFDKDENSLLR